MDEAGRIMVKVIKILVIKCKIQLEEKNSLCFMRCAVITGL